MAKRLIYSGAIAVIAVLGIACGSTNVTQLTAPDAPRCQTNLATLPTVPAAGGKVEVSLVTERECAWTATSNSPWIQISPATGQGEASITLSSTANPQGVARSGNIAVNGSQFAVTQAASPCTFTVSPGEVSIPAEGSSAELGVTTLTGCSWTASSPASWITLSPASGTNAGTVRLLIAENGGTATRSATLTIAGRPVTIGQAGTPAPQPGPSPVPTPTPTPTPTPNPPPPTPTPNPPPPTNPPPTTPPPVSCTYSLDPFTSVLKPKGDGETVRVTTGASCAWTATSNVPWAEIKGASSGTGSGTVRYEVERNRSSLTRFGTITIASATHFIVQRGDD